MAKRTAVYLRVSSATQSDQSQVPDLERWCAVNGVEFAAACYRDTFTGTTMDRPGWKALERDVHSGKVGRVVVWRLDRFGRTAAGLTALVRDFVERGVGLVSVREGLDLSTPAGRLMVHVIASIAEYETEVRKERQVAGIAAAKQHGTRSGKPFGRPKGLKVPKKVTAERRALIVRLKGEDESVASIARVTGLSRSTVYEVLAGGGGC